MLSINHNRKGPQVSEEQLNILKNAIKDIEQVSEDMNGNMDLDTIAWELRVFIKKNA